MSDHPSAGAAHLDLAFDLFHAACAGRLDRNVVLSPLGVQTALALLLEGAAGATAAEIRAALRQSEQPAGQARAGLAALRQSLLAPLEQVEIALASSLWAAIPLRQEFIDQARAGFGAMAGSADFSDPRAIERINAWVSAQTRGKIPAIVDQPDPLIAALLLDAVYFSGRWQHPFDEKRTRERSFKCLKDGQVSEKPVRAMWNNEETYSAYNNREQKIELVRLPYGAGELSMTIIHPDITALSAISTLDSSTWREWTTLLAPVEELVVQLPIFSIDHNLALKPVLQSLGMELAFDQQRADFSPMTGVEPGVYVSKALQRTVIEVAEQGTVAAAVTKIEMKVRGMAAPKPSVIVNSPFFFAISDSRSGAILFMGWIADPAPEE